MKSTALNFLFWSLIIIFGTEKALNFENGAPYSSMLSANFTLSSPLEANLDFDCFDVALDKADGASVSGKLNTC